jgi:hypothetical protein
MRNGLSGLDHLVVLVHDLDAAQTAWQRMGFALTPRGHHTLGSSNHCMMFGRDYLELLAVPTPHPSMAYFTDYLSRSEGLAAFAFSASDGLAAHAAFVADGIAADAPFDFSRPVERAGGRDARFRIVQLPERATPGLRAFVCQHFTPEVVWLPEDLAHPNGATGVAGVLVSADEPGAVASAYAALAGTTSHGPDADGVVRVDIGSVVFEFADPRTVAVRLRGAEPLGRTGPHAAAVRIGVSDPAAARACLRAGDVPLTELADGQMVVPASFSQGVAVVFGSGHVAP